MTTVEPGNGKVGDELVVTGENLAKPGVAKLYLTDGKNDTEVTVTEQAATTIKFKIPPPRQTRAVQPDDSHRRERAEVYRTAGESHRRVTALISMTGSGPAPAGV